MKISDYLLKRLAFEGIDTAYTVYGGALGEILDAFTRQNDIRYICPHHEQAASFAAEGYAKAKGVPGLAIGTSGPGGHNMVTGIANCYYDSTPAIFITGQVQTKLINPTMSGFRQLGFQETPIVDIVLPITKFASQVMNANLFPQILESAITECKFGRPGPVLLDIPIDVQKAEIDPQVILKSVKDLIYYDCKPAVEDYIGALKKSKRPGILVGGGARSAKDKIFRFAFDNKIPVFRTWNALDIITDDFLVFGGTVGTYGGKGRNFGIQNCDLLLCLGTRLSGRITGGMPETFARGAKKFIVDIDCPSQNQVRGVNIPVSCKEFMDQLLLHSLDPEDEWYKWLLTCVAWRQHYDPAKAPMSSKDFHHYQFMRRFSNMLPYNATVVYDTGGNAIMMGHCFESKWGQRIFSSNGNTPMGFAMCAAIGAWHATPERPIICVIGDGGMCMNSQELQTLVRYGITIKIFIINNHILGNTKSYQRVNKMAEVACGPDGYEPPNFKKLANAYGIPYRSISEWEEVKPVVNEAMGSLYPFIVDVIDHDRCDYNPRISRWDSPVEEMFPFLPENEFKENMIIEPLNGWKERRD